MTTKQFAGVVLAASIGVLGAALLSQYWGGLQPCELCLLQRWPWWVAIAISAATWLTGNRLRLPVPAILLGMVFLVSAGIAFYHVGVEQHWFAGPSACTAGNATATTVEELRRQLMGKQAVLCDRVQWSLLGVSLAGWNFVASLLMLAFCAAAIRRAPDAARVAA
ncbi:MAG TPA: disulfide bond formation protein B [Stellaceae bacterium]|nr:disulfide bond formation protein B [Stellaceae bacterium]